jgi:general stress protein YciG
MPLDRDSLDALKNIISEVDLILATTPDLPQNRTGRSRELLRTALAITDDLISENRKADKSHAAALGRKGGAATAHKLGSDHFRELAKLRKARHGGRPKNPPDSN